MSTRPQDHVVAEFQGLYGPFVCPERVLQKIWARGEFARGRAETVAGERVEVVRLGKWNSLGGPDFHDAAFRIAGRLVEGDVEVHFHARDWNAHGHGEDRKYDRVVLHVVLFPPPAGSEGVRHRDGRAIPTLVLLPLLLRDLEECVSDDGLEVLTARDDWRALAELENRSPAEVRHLLGNEAEMRWRQKVRFARLRIERLGWEGAAHRTVLEILGYRLNRTPMLMAAESFPLAWWRQDGDASSAFEAFEAEWETHGVRPANQPLTRLRQYEQWARAMPDWPDRLRRSARVIVAQAAEAARESPRAFRRQARLTELRETLARDIAERAVGGTRFDNLVCDGFLPMLAAAGHGEFFGTWFHWFVGDVPGRLRAALKKLGLIELPEHPATQGLAQGVLGWMMGREFAANHRSAIDLPDA